MQEAAQVADRPRGAALGIAGQATFVGAWLLGVVGAVAGSELGLLAAVGGVVALVLTIVALFMMRPWLGGLAPAAAWVLIGGLALGVVLFAAIPGGREWGKLGAFIMAVAALGLALTVAHLLLGLALWRAHAPRLGAIAAACEVLAIVAVGGVAAGGEEPFGFLAIGASVAAHVLILVGLSR